MQSYVDDSELAKILTEANLVMSGISGKKEMDSQEMMEIARRIASNTNSYTGTGSSPSHFVERSAMKVKSKIGMHIDMLKSTASNISEIKKRIKKGPEPRRPALPEVRPQANPDADQLSDYNRKIDETLKYLSTKTTGKTKIEEKIKKYRDIMGDVEGSLRELPKAMKEGKVKKTKALDHKLLEKVDNKAGQMMKKIRDLAPRDNFDWAERYGSEDDEEGVGDWINYEGFNCKEDLDKYNEIFKDFVGEYPHQYEKRNQEEGYYDKDGMGRAIDTTKPGRQRRRGLYSPRNNDLAETEAMKRCKEMEEKLRGVLSKSKNGDGDSEVGTIMSERRFLEDYVDKKMDTIHTADGFLTKEETEKKKNSSRKAGTKKKTEDEKGRLCLDGLLKKETIVEDVDLNPPGSPERSSKKSILPSLSNNYSNEKKKMEVTRPKSSDEKKGMDEHDINWDMERIKKLIVKERQEHLRKKREAWERNNELSDEMIDREKMMTLKKGLFKPSGLFDAPIPSTKPRPSDFLTDRERHDKMFRKAVKGREGVYHKEDLDYEFGVNPLYYEPIKNTNEGGDSKDVPISIKAYRGVRKKTET